MNKTKMKENIYTKEFSLINKIKDDPNLYKLYDGLNEEWQKRITDFFSGKKTLPILYDPFFKKFFDAELYPERLSDFISCIIGEKVTILQILSREELHIEGGSIIILDIIVKLEDGSIANVEIQKDPYAFPGQRISCYSADLLLRQYNKIKKEKGATFSYKDMHKVYTIVIYEKTPKAFHGLTGNPYLHKGRTLFNSGINIDILNNYYLVALDVFKKYVYDEFMLGNQHKKLEEIRFSRNNVNSGLYANLSNNVNSRNNLDSENNMYSENNVNSRDTVDSNQNPDSIRQDRYENEKLIGWLSFLVTENMSDVESVIKHFPWLEELYMEMAALKNDPDEILRASSEALAILDRNTMQYVIDEMSETIDKQQKALDASNKQLNDANKQLDDANKQLDDANKQLDDANKQLDDANLLHEQDSATIRRLTEELEMLKKEL